MKIKTKKIDKIINSKEYQNAVFEIVSQFTDEVDKTKLARFFLNDENFETILPIYKRYIKNQLTDSGIKFLAIKIREIIKE